MDFIFDPSLMLYLPLYELDGASFMSKDKHGHLCTVTGAIWTPRGRSFDGDDDYIDVPYSKLLTNAGTIEIWSKASGQIFVVSDKDTSNVDRFALSIHGAQHRIDITYRKANAYGYRLLSADFTIIPTDWTHIVVQSDGSTVKVYANLVELTLTEASGTNAGEWLDNLNNIDNCLIGAENREGVYLFDANGTIGELRYYSRTLTPQEIQYNYQATKWRYK